MEAELPNEGAEGEGMLTQADLDALIAASQADATEGLSEERFSEEGFSEGSLSEEREMPSETSAGLVDFPDFGLPASPSEAFSAPSGSGGLNRVRDIPLEVAVELGRTRLLIRDILDLSPGSIIELDKLAGEPVDLFANGMLMARGEVIVIDDNFGVRVTEIITAAEHTNPEKDIHALAA